MKIVDKGVLQPSFMDFTIPSAFAKSALYYVPRYGHFFCDEHYYIERDYLDMYLFMYVNSGRLHVQTGGKSYEAAAGDIVLLDCHQKHQYWCSDSADFMWFHFSGCSSPQYADYIIEQKGICISDEIAAKQKYLFEKILLTAQAIMVNEHLLSQQITQLFAALASPPAVKILLNHPFIPAIEYIASHYSENIGLQMLCTQCALSISHFIRGFKAQTGCTPHEYLLAYRLRQSKQLLISSSYSIEEIAARCGFNSASHYARAFRKSEHISPTQFRKLDF